MAGRGPGRPKGTGWIALYRAWLQHPARRRLPLQYAEIHTRLLMQAARGVKYPQLAGILCTEAGKPFSIRALARRIDVPRSTLMRAIEAMRDLPCDDGYAPLVGVAIVDGREAYCVPDYGGLVRTPGESWERGRGSVSPVGDEPASAGPQVAAVWDVSGPPADQEWPTGGTKVVHQRDKSGPLTGHSDSLISGPQAGQKRPTNGGAQTQGSQATTSDASEDIAEVEMPVSSPPRGESREGNKRINYEEGLEEPRPPQGKPDRPASRESGKAQPGGNAKELLQRMELRSAGFTDEETAAILNHRQLSTVEKATGHPGAQEGTPKERRSFLVQRLGLEIILKRVAQEAGAGEGPVSVRTRAGRRPNDEHTPRQRRPRQSGAKREE